MDDVKNCLFIQLILGVGHFAVKEIAGDGFREPFLLSLRGAQLCTLSQG